MTRFRLAALLLPLLALLLLPGAAQATTTASDVAQSLRSDLLYFDPQSGVPMDEGQVRDVLERSTVPIYVAALPQDAGPLIGVVPDLLRELPDDAVVFAINDEPDIRVDQNSGANDLGVFSGEALEAATSGAPRSFTEDSVNQRVLRFVEAVNAQAAGGAVPGQRQPSSSGGVSGTAVGVLALAAAGGGAFLYARGRKQQSRALQDARADVESLYGRLGSDVQLLSPGDDAIARQALADAAERYNATGALMAKADTPGEFAAARRTAIEGITAARVVRERLGLDPGPDVPMPASSSAPQLTEPSRVQIDDQEYDGSPTYTPGRPHYYEGGYYGGRPIPGGWYATPFWQSLLLSSVLSGGMGRRRGYGGMYGGFGGGLGGFGGGGRGGGGWGGGSRGGGGFGGGGRGGGGW